MDLRLFPNFSRLSYRPILKSLSFRYLLQGKRRNVRPRTFPKRFSSTLSTYLEKSEFSVFVTGQKTKCQTSDFFQTFLVFVIDLSGKVRVFVICYRAKDEMSDLGLFPNVSRLRYRPILKSPSFRYLLLGKRRKVGPRTFSKRFSPTLSTKSRTLDLIEQSPRGPSFRHSPCGPWCEPKVKPLL